MKNLYAAAVFLFLAVVLSAEDVPGNLDRIVRRLESNPDYAAAKFVFPVGNRTARGYYNALAFGKASREFGGNLHLGEDWNGVGGGNSDYGDPVYCTANGIAVFTGYGGPGWGDVIRIVHRLPEKSDYRYMESVYGHVSRIFVKEGDFIRGGQVIGRIGNAGGRYYAHLHFELRNDINMPLGGGYAPALKGFVDPTRFIRNHR